MGLFDKKKKTQSDEEVSENEAVVEVAQSEEQKKTTKRTKAKKTEATEEAGEETTKSHKHMKANDTLVHSLVSEKSATGESMGVYTFVVQAKANKIEIKKAVKDMYNVMPTKVRVLNVEGKDTRFGNKQGKRSSWKKAIVTLPKGKTINIHEGV